MGPKNPNLASFMHFFSLYNLIKSNTCFKGCGSCINLILTNRNYWFKHTSTFETRLSDDHCFICSMLKATFKINKNRNSLFNVTIKTLIIQIFEWT